MLASNPKFVSFKQQIGRLPEGLTLKECSERLNLNNNSAKYWLKKFDYMFRDGRERAACKVTPEQWKATNWMDQDAFIARCLKVSKERVRQMRNKLKQPKSPNHKRRLACEKAQ